MIIGDIETTEKVEYEDLLKNYYEKMEIIEKQDEEIERLNKCYCERTDCSGRIKNSKKYESVQEENERLHSIIKEAINYIDDNTYYKDHKGHINIDDLYLILQKGSESNE